jgi:hypothetical protein
MLYSLSILQPLRDTIQRIGLTPNATMTRRLSELMRRCNVMQGWNEVSYGGMPLEAITWHCTPTSDPRVMYFAHNPFCDERIPQGASPRSHTHRRHSAYVRGEFLVYECDPTCPRVEKLRKQALRLDAGTCSYPDPASYDENVVHGRSRCPIVWRRNQIDTVR